MACVSKLGADLMGPSGYQLALHQGQAVSGLKRPVVGQGGFGAWLRLCCDVDPVLDGILENLPTQGPLGRDHGPVNDCQVSLVQLPVLYLLVENPQGFGIFGGDDNAAGIPVDPVAQGRDKGGLPGPLA